MFLDLIINLSRSSTYSTSALFLRKDGDASRVATRDGKHVSVRRTEEVSPFYLRRFPSSSYVFVIEYVSLRKRQAFVSARRFVRVAKGFKDA